MLRPTKIVEWVTETPSQGRNKGAVIKSRRISWELNGKRYRTRREAINDNK